MYSRDTQSLIQVFTQREWAWSWQGTALSGCVFGAFRGDLGFGLGRSVYQGIEGVAFGATVGYFIAGFVGALIFPTIATLLWTCCLLDRNQFVDKALAGGITGFVCAFASWPACIVTSILGATGSCLPSLIARRRSREKQVILSVRFGMRGMLLRIFVIAALVVLWKSIIFLWINPQAW